MENNNKHIMVAMLFALLFAGSIFIAFPGLYDLSETYRKFFTIILGSIFISVFSWNRCQIIDLIFKAICICGLLETIYALAQFFKCLPSYNLYYTYTGSFENPAVFAMLLAMCVPVAIYYALKKRKGYVWWWIIALYLLIFIGFSEARTSLLAACAGVMVIVIDNNHIRKWLSNRWIWIAGIPVILVLLFLIYRFKADSANGRLLIWRVSLDMFREKPIFGWGPGGFLAHYMDHQADYLSSHPDTRFLLLADNCNNPFNEYILVLVNYGITGIVCLSLLLLLLFKKLSSLNCEHKKLLISLAVVLMSLSMFSYPFSVPFVWVLTGLIFLAAIIPKNSITCSLVSSICLVAIVVSVPKLLNERKWKIIMRESMAGNTEAVLPDFQQLYEKMYYNGQFMYNYAAELHFSNHYDESLKIMKECVALLNDYDVQMILGDDYQQTGDSLSAIKHYTYASQMVPSKLLPHYYTMRLYTDMGDSVMAIKTAEKILSMDVKVKRSKAVQKIITEAKELLNFEEVK